MIIFFQDNLVSGNTPASEYARIGKCAILVDLKLFEE